jgi:hypothetical protein
MFRKTAPMLFVQKLTSPKCKRLTFDTSHNSFRPPIAFIDLIQNDDFTEPIKPGSGPRSTLPRSRRRSQNTDNLSCAMSALSFLGEGRDYKSYSIRPEVCNKCLFIIFLFSKQLRPTFGCHLTAIKAKTMDTTRPVRSTQVAPTTYQCLIR